MHFLRPTILALVAFLVGCKNHAIDINPTRVGSPQIFSATSRAQPAISGVPESSVSIVTFLSLQWTAPDDVAPAGYNLYYSDIGPRQYTHQIQAGNNLSVTTSNFVPGVRYYFAVTAVDENGIESDFSPEYVYDMPTMLDIGFVFQNLASNIVIQSSSNLEDWESCSATLRNDGLWRVTVSNSPVIFYRGEGIEIPATPAIPPL